MIVSHKYKFIFIAIPKTATHAIRFALRPQLDEGDWEQVELFHKSRLPFEEFKSVNHGHITSLDAKKVLGDKIWNTYYKFCFVRNPYDRFMSYAFFRNKSSDLFLKKKYAMMKLIFKNPLIEKDILFYPQSNFIIDDAGVNMVDFIGRYENLQLDFDKICEKVGLPKITLQSVNLSNREGDMHNLDFELLDLVSNYYEEDIEIFKYKAIR